MPIKPKLDENQAREEVQSAHPQIHPKLIRSMERKIESFWEAFEKRGWSFVKFTTAIIEVLIVLEHRIKLTPAGEASEKILNGMHDAGFNDTRIPEMAERALNAKAGLPVPPMGASWKLQPALQTIGEAGEDISGAARGLWDEPVRRPRILVVEDEAPVARDIANILRNAGFETVGPAGGPARALELVSRIGCDAAVLDIRLGRGTSEPVALALRRRGTPFIAVSAYSRKEMPAGFGDPPLLDKPLQAELLIAHLKRCVEGQGAGRP
jgi:CheY-like chemotaxis protein